MRIGKVIGHLWATQKNVNLTGSKLLIVQPIMADGTDSGNPVVAVDTVNAGPDCVVILAQKREAINPLPNPFTPVDHTIVGIVENVDS